MMEFEKMKIKFAKSIKWDLVRKKRLELLQIQHETIERNHRGEVLVHKAKFFLIIFRIRAQINQRIRQKSIQMNLVFRINCMKYKFKKKLLKQRKTLQARLLQQYRYALMWTSHVVMERVCESKAVKKLNRFMFVRDLNFTVRGHVQYFFEKVIFIQQAWRRHNRCLNLRKQYLMGEYWDSSVT